jgi:biopolymer transport protein ExbB
MKTLAFFLTTAFVAPGASAQDPQFKSLDDLLQSVKSGMRTASEELAKREAEFLAEKKKQKGLLKNARQRRDAATARGESLERSFEENENRIAELEETLRSRLGNMGELFGVIRQVAGDTRGHISASITTSQLPGRAGPLGELAESKGLPSVKQLENLWFALAQEATESGKVVRYSATVIKPDGKEVQQEVVRVGPFNAVAGGKYLKWDQNVQKLRELARQPPGQYLGTIPELESAKSGIVRTALDPSRGQILETLVDTPTLRERLEFGGYIGLIIMLLGALGFVIGMIRLVQLFVVGAKVRVQEGKKEPNENNPLGRVMKVHADNIHLDTETVELKLDEAIVREQSRLERFLWAIKVVSVVAPLLGLLGTVTGMIKTFQNIVLFGTGDPKMMAGGISEALVTTMLGLIVAIPLVLLHSWVKSLTTRVMDVLSEQSTGIIAEHAEKEKAA